MLHVFVRSWWKVVRNQYGQEKLEPHMGKKYTLGYVNTEEEARQMCKEYNDTHAPGKTIRKAEYQMD